MVPMMLQLEPTSLGIMHTESKGKGGEEKEWGRERNRQRGRGRKKERERWERIIKTGSYIGMWNGETLNPY